MIAALVLAVLTSTVTAHYAVTTKDPPAQADFDRGLTLLYAYNGDAARGVFEQALQRDPHLAMAAWGEALASGTDLNTALDPDRFARAHDASQQAALLAEYASPEEREYISAVVERYAGTYSDRDADEARYRTAMAQLVSDYPNDDDAAMLDAEALLEHLGTSRMWSADGTTPAPDTATALSLISHVLARDPNNIMANHLCMHAYDFARDRTPALACAARVESWSFDPQEEHLAHMPAHTYIETGQYQKAIEASDRAWQLHPTKYAAHDAYTGWSAAMMIGDLQTAQLWAQRAGQAYNGSDLWATWARFSQWQWIAHSTAQNEFYAPLARGLTDLHLGTPDDARKMLALYGNLDADYRWLLEAALDEHDGKIQPAVDAYNRAIAYQNREDEAETLPLFPAGEYLGALYYRHGQYQAAVQAFQQTLSRYPNDPRALYGLALAQRALGQAVSSEQTLKSFSAIWKEPMPPDIAGL